MFLDIIQKFSYSIAYINCKQTQILLYLLIIPNIYLTEVVPKNDTAEQWKISDLSNTQQNVGAGPTRKIVFEGSKTALCTWNR